MPKANDHKLALEERQRVMIKHMKKANPVWKPQQFTWDEQQQRLVPIALNLTPPVLKERPHRQYPRRSRCQRSWTISSAPQQLCHSTSSTE
jgi:hypothetical protein